MNMSHFKRCPGCNSWLSLDNILDADGVEGKGLITDPNEPDHCLFQFKHASNDCKSTFSIHSRDFVKIMRLDISGVYGLGGPNCNGQCSNYDDLSSCNTKCRIHGLRELMLSIMLKQDLYVS